MAYTLARVIDMDDENYSRGPESRSVTALAAELAKARARIAEQDALIERLRANRIAATANEDRET